MSPVAIRPRLPPTCTFGNGVVLLGYESPARATIAGQPLRRPVGPHRTP